MTNIIVEDYNNNSFLSKHINLIEENTKYFITFKEDVVDSIVSIKYLDWDSNIFNKKIGLFSICYGRLDKATSNKIMNTVDQFYIKENYECIFTKLSTDDYYTAHILENSGYNLMDSIITLKKKLTLDSEIKDNINCDIKLLDEADIDNVTKIIDNLYSYGRFFVDEKLDKENVNELYKQWITNEIKNSDVDVIGINKNNKLIGFMSCKYKVNDIKELEGVINLVGIDKLYQGIGIGKELMNSVLNYLKNKNIGIVNVGTQINNIAAINFYISNGFSVVGSVNSLHKWIDVS